MGSEDKEQLMTNDDRWTVEALLGAFDEDLRRTRGVCEGTRGNYTRHVRAFLATVSAHGGVDVARIGVGDVVSFVGTLTEVVPGLVEFEWRSPA
jgi:Phage integrase, N-terminal SAM-like domain